MSNARRDYARDLYCLAGSCRGFAPLAVADGEVAKALPFRATFHANQPPVRRVRPQKVAVKPPTFSHFSGPQTVDLRKQS
jgi:hypothetical protein